MKVGSRVRRGRIRFVAVSGLAWLLVTGVAAQASVSAVPDDTARINGTVYAVAQVGDRTIIGGDFTTVGGLPRLHVAAILPDGHVDKSFVADTDGTVHAIAVSADGTIVYAGGTFTQVDGTPRANLVAVDAATGVPVQSWSADTAGEVPDVAALVVSGSTLYVGGRFTGIDGTTRKRMVALDSAGDVIKSFKPAPNASVRVLSVSSNGTRLFAGGSFTVIGGQSRTSVAELDQATGLARPFAVMPIGSYLSAMGTSPDGSRLYYGVGDNRVFAWDTNSDTLVWTIKNSGDTQAIAASDTEVYLGGHFSQNIDTKTRRIWIESVHSQDGSLTSWDPQMSGGSMGVWAISATSTKVLVGGEFTSVGGLPIKRFARFSGTP